jgi:hypothetical protein
MFLIRTRREGGGGGQRVVQAVLVQAGSGRAEPEVTAQRLIPVIMKTYYQWQGGVTQEDHLKEPNIPKRSSSTY